jgi:hypothetical protein
LTHVQIGYFLTRIASKKVPCFLIVFLCDCCSSLDHFFISFVIVVWFQIPCKLYLYWSNYSFGCLWSRYLNFILLHTSVSSWACQYCTLKELIQNHHRQFTMTSWQLIGVLFIWSNVDGRISWLSLKQDPSKWASIKGTIWTRFFQVYYTLCATNKNETKF